MRTAVQNQFPLVDWLLSTSLSQMIENAWQNGSLPTVTDEDGNVYLKAPLNVFTTPPKILKVNAVGYLLILQHGAKHQLIFYV